MWNTIPSKDEKKRFHRTSGNEPLLLVVCSNRGPPNFPRSFMFLPYTQIDKFSGNLGHPTVIKSKILQEVPSCSPLRTKIDPSEIEDAYTAMLGSFFRVLCPLGIPLVFFDIPSGYLTSP